MKGIPQLLLSLALSFSFAQAVRAQLAITEVMSASRINTNTSFRGPEYWELTNFSTNDLNLDGYGFRDSVTTRPLVRDVFTNLVLPAGKSMIFFRIADSKEVVTNAAGFHAWWGGTRLPANLQFRIWRSPGLSGWDGDAVWLFDSNRTLVDAVEFGRAQPGRAFTFEPDTGLFGVFSAASVNGAFTAELADDVGSPGFTVGPVAIRVLEQPANQSVDAGMNVLFAVSAVGLPRPRFQWLRDGTPLPGETAATLLLSSVQPAYAGVYQVVMANGLEFATSAIASLTVNTVPAPPSILVAPEDSVVFERQSAVFKVSARGLPAPGYQWQADGIPIAGANGPVLEIPAVHLTNSSMRYSVRVWNALGSTNASATLTVTRRPDLRFTEVMPLPFDEEGNRHFDWFEVTNFDTNAVNLLHWRFSDRPSFAGAVTITNALWVRPGESVVFAERLPETLFKNWWGVDSLPADFKFYSYSGFGLAYLGEQLYLWNPAATDPHDPLATISWAAATTGVSFECDRFCYPDIGCFDEATRDSAFGVNGAFRAADGLDIGSPGCIANPPLAILSMRHDSTSVNLRCRVIPGKAYRLWRALSPAGSDWGIVQVRTAANNVLTLTDAQSPSGPARFYRVEVLP
jgi:hypothetical protein